MGNDKKNIFHFHSCISVVVQQGNKKENEIEIDLFILVSSCVRYRWDNIENVDS